VFVIDLGRPDCWKVGVNGMIGEMAGNWSIDSRFYTLAALALLVAKFTHESAHPRKDTTVRCKKKGFYNPVVQNIFTNHHNSTSWQMNTKILLC